MKRVIESKEVAGQSPNYLLAKLQDLVDWAVNSSRANSLWPMPFGTACCAIEFMATAASRYDFARFGMERQAFSPRQADVLICAGRLPFKLAPVIRRIYDQMPQPKWVISMGACASTGGIFDNYAMVQGIDTIVPVDVYVPGCPPRPEGLLYGVLRCTRRSKASRCSTASHAARSSCSTSAVCDSPPSRSTRSPSRSATPSTSSARREPDRRRPASDLRQRDRPRARVLRRHHRVRRAPSPARRHDLAARHATAGL